MQGGIEQNNITTCQIYPDIYNDHMARSKSDIANSAIRIFLQDVGKFYDEKRGFKPFIPNKSQKEELLNYFNYQCCFCGDNLTAKTLSQDHLVPMNKTLLGLHSWGNVVPCCKDCNNEKQQKSWEDFIKTKASGGILKNREKNITNFVHSKKYDPNLNLHDYADNL
ncbi:MAG: hypothetical protein HN929_10700 [Chloroflexi bacterium]|nr:hypothetical protein [Chloroflexota bacterium]MBT7081913.1 hypothetical protein [Chloroflexota bacterium]MBT7289816.1 hypothetical protein [Chloroflexota bacterium]